MNRQPLCKAYTSLARNAGRLNRTKKNRPLLTFLILAKLKQAAQPVAVVTSLTNNEVRMWIAAQQSWLDRPEAEKANRDEVYIEGKEEKERPRKIMTDLDLTNKRKMQNLVIAAPLHYGS